MWKRRLERKTLIHVQREKTRMPGRRKGHATDCGVQPGKLREWQAGQILLHEGERHDRVEKNEDGSYRLHTPKIMLKAYPPM